MEQNNLNLEYTKSVSESGSLSFGVAIALYMGIIIGFVTRNPPKKKKVFLKIYFLVLGILLVFGPLFLKFLVIINLIFFLIGHFSSFSGRSGGYRGSFGGGFSGGGSTRGF